MASPSLLDKVRSEEASRSQASRSFLAGLCAGFAACVVGHPFDTVKLLQQTASAGGSSLQASAVKLFSSGGFRAFWPGLGPALAVQALTCGFVFGAQSRISAWVSDTALGQFVETDAFVIIPTEFRLQQTMAISSVSCASVSGFLTGGLLSPLVCPLEAVKCRSQVAKNLTTTGFANLYSGQRLQSYYSGFSATVMRCSVGNAAFFGMYELTKQSDHIGASLGGALAGTAFWVAAMPFDVVKSRMQTAQTPLSFTATLRRAVAGGGSRVLYAGLPVSLMRAIPMNAACFFTYEAVMTLSADFF